METQQQTPPAPAPNFDFIVNQQQKSKVRFPNPLKSLPKMIQIALAALIVVMVLGIGYKTIFGPKNSGPANAPAMIAQQQEIIRVSNLALTDAKDQSTKDIAATTVLTVTSQQKGLEDLYLGSTKKKLSPKVLDANKDTTTDDKLTAAGQNNAYDKTFLSYLKSSLTDYQNNLVTANKSASTKSHVIYAEAYASNGELLTSNLIK